ncbi:peptidoglycan editing factor PgeF [Altererythrobacter lutimaris]|uniref:Purine nucleoside phosphorylase n=1 Tax=Altererythrobacter lutimaris TaxID=2743979 RepID=A0A850HD40_9SPHN|nr:peptidoglycan editing factor PgeF [Altererythrobacter lutimaris]NVE95490.1 peptidoglycan editing factor PgeF [Altererythrobacter lutimaris]
MTQRPEPFQSDVIKTPHGFLTGPQSERKQQDLVGGDMPTVWLKQVHSSDVLHVTRPFPDGERPEVDAMVTTTQDLKLAIVTADCAPVLMEDKTAGVIGAAHAGWRGAHGGVLEKTVHAMIALGATPSNIAAAIGPCIAQKSYEVDEGFRAQFRLEDAQFFANGKPGHFQFDLEGYCAMRLANAGVTRIDCLGVDTYARAEDFFSYRRATHQSAPTDGRQVSVIALSGG